MTQIIDCPPFTSPRTGTSLELAAVKTRQQATWASGDYATIGTTLQIVGETLCEAVDLRAGSRVLDVACGNGNAALAAARRWCDVTGLDYVPSLLDGGVRRAAAERLPVKFVEGDAEHLPFADAEFDVVLSTYGVMFSPDHRRIASELLRVCKPGGKIGLANWTPASFVGQLLATVGRFVPPPPGLVSPTQWGVRGHLDDLFAGGAKAIRIEARLFMFRYQSPEHFIDVFRRYYGPTHKAFGALDATRQAELALAIDNLLREHNIGGDRSLVVPGEYLEVVIERA